MQPAQPSKRSGALLRESGSMQASAAKRHTCWGWQATQCMLRLEPHLDRVAADRLGLTCTPAGDGQYFCFLPKPPQEPTPPYCIFSFDFKPLSKPMTPQWHLQFQSIAATRAHDLPAGPQV